MTTFKLLETTYAGTKSEEYRKMLGGFSSLPIGTRAWVTGAEGNLASTYNRLRKLSGSYPVYVAKRGESLVLVRTRTAGESKIWYNVDVGVAQRRRG